MVHRAIAKTVAWGLIAAVARSSARPASLRVVELHPGGGQGDVLRLLKQDGAGPGVYNTPYVTLGDFNLAAGTLESQDGVDTLLWLERWLSDPDRESINHLVLQGMNLPLGQREQYPCRRLFGIELIAAVLGQALTGKACLEARMGFMDSSGITGGGVHPALLGFPRLFNVNEIAIRQGEDSAAAECWLLKNLWNDEIVGAIRTDGLFSTTGNESEIHDLYHVYSLECRIDVVLPLVNQILFPNIRIFL